MIVKLPGGQLRDLIPTVMSFSKNNLCPLNSDDKFGPDDVSPGWHLGGGRNGMTLATACTFKIFSLETILFNSEPEKFAKSALILRVGEKEYVNTPVLGEPVNNGKYHFRNFRLNIDLKHEFPIGNVDTENVDIKTFNSFVCINPLQYFEMKVRNIPHDSLLSLQVNLVGYLFRPVA